MATRVGRCRGQRYLIAPGKLALGDGLTVCLQVVERAVNGTQLTAFQRGVVAAASCNATWTRTMLIKTGVLVSPLCPLCAAAQDTVHHWLWG